jgi:heme-degrading monooxygenase HmoA
MSDVYSSGAWTVKEGEGEAFVEAWADFAGWLSEMPGAGTARLTRDLSDPQRYFSFAPWESVDAMHAWKTAPEFGERMAAVQEHVAGFTPSELELIVEV